MKSILLLTAVLVVALSGCQSKKLADYNLTEAEAERLIQFKSQLATLIADSTKGLFQVEAFRSEPIKVDLARDRTKEYNDLLKKTSFGSGSNTLYKFFHGPDAPVTGVTPAISYKVRADHVREVLNQSESPDWLLIYPAFRKVTPTTEDPRGFHYTFVIAGGKTNGTNMDVLTGKLYDEIGSCPPPNGCKGF